MNLSNNCEIYDEAIADAIHYDKISLKKIRNEFLNSNLEVRNLD